MAWGGTSTTLSHTITGTNPGIIVWCPTGTTTSPITDVTWNGVSLGAAVLSYRENGGGGYDFYHSLYYAQNVTTGTHDVVVTRTASGGDLVVLSYTGLGSVEHTAHGNNTAATITSTNTTTNAAAILFAIFGPTGSGGGSGMSAGTGCTAIRTNYVNNVISSPGDSVGISLTPGSNTMTGNRVSGNAFNWWAGVAFAPYSAPAGPANLKSYNTNLKANIKSIDTNLIANIKSLDTNV